jgi:hypothetical protein
MLLNTEKLLKFSPVPASSRDRRDEHNGQRRDEPFVAADNPTPTKLTIHILAAVAEHEREAISFMRDRQYHMCAVMVFRPFGRLRGTCRLQRRVDRRARSEPKRQNAALELPDAFTLWCGFGERGHEKSSYGFPWPSATLRER